MISIDPGLRGCGVSKYFYYDKILVDASYVTNTIKKDERNTLHHKAVYNIYNTRNTFYRAERWVALALAVEKWAGEPISIVVVEAMTIYPHLKGDPSDLLEIQAVVGAILARFPDAVHVAVDARTWKGQVPRDIFAARIEKKLRERGWWDRVQIPSRKTHLNDVLHAAGLGLWYLERG